MNVRVMLASLLLFNVSLINAMEMPKSTYQGDYFTAIPIPLKIKNIIAEVQTELFLCLGENFSASPLDNLHITIQVMEGSNEEKMKQGLKNVSTPFKQWAQKKGWDKTWHFEKKIKEDPKLRFGDEGHVKLHLGKSDLLVHLGKIIEEELKNSGVTTKRNDVAGSKYSAHITLGMIPKDFVKKARSLQCNIDLKKKFASAEFIIDRFVLLHSNWPEKIRQYAVRGEYMLNLDK